MTGGVDAEFQGGGGSSRPVPSGGADGDVGAASGIAEYAGYRPSFSAFCSAIISRNFLRCLRILAVAK